MRDCLAQSLWQNESNTSYNPEYNGGVIDSKLKATGRKHDEQGLHELPTCGFDEVAWVERLGKTRFCLA